VLEVCSGAESSEGAVLKIESISEDLLQRYQDLSARGYRTLGVAYRRVHAVSTISQAEETGMTFLGFLVFHDPPKPGIIEPLDQLHRLGVSLKVMTGDNRLVAATLSEKIGLPEARIVTGRELRSMSDEALAHDVGNIDIFAEVEPNQKERVILALKKSGHVVGYMGDGINDASALHAADVGISVDGAVDVAKDAADIVLLEKDLNALVNGVREGRETFANTLKYVFMATSANFGNMFSMAGASLFLPFLPLLPKQILLMNLLTDLPEMTIASDTVDPELIDRPRRWNIRYIRNFMISFGILSSVFDFITFGVLIFLLQAGTDQFRTAWFVESVLSASMIVLVIRTRHPFFRSRPGRGPLWTTLAVAVCLLAMPYTPVAAVFGFTALPAAYILLMLLVVVFYVIGAEATKRIFYRKVNL